MTREEGIKRAQELFGQLIAEDFERIDRMKHSAAPLNFDKLNPIIVGIMPGDGIGPVLMPLALRVLDALVGDEIERGKIKIKQIEA